MRIIFFLVPALLASILLPAQDKYFTRGKIVTHAGDTISGFIERLRDNALDDGITFKKALDSRQQQWLTPDSISAFILPDEKRVYEPVTFDDTINTTVIHKIKFANLLLKGYCSLYILYLRPAEVHTIFESGNDHIFLAKKSGDVTVLAEYESVINSVYKLDKQYVDLLKRLFSDCPSLSPANIARTDFYAKSMVAIFTKYNLCLQPGAVPETFKTKEKIKIKSTVYGGYAMFISKESQPVSGMTLGLFFSIVHPRVNERLAISVGINYKNCKYSIFNTFDNFKETYNANLVGMPIKATYYFSNGKISPFLDFGIIPTSVKTNYVDNKGPGVSKGVEVFGSAGPGVNIGHLYLSALVELTGIVMIKEGSYYSFRIGYRF